jgi:hypothetical protein
MNGKQIGVMWIGILVVSALLLYPPFVMMPDMGGALRSQISSLFGSSSAPHQITLIKYGLLFAPPDGSISIDAARQWPPVVLAALVFSGLVATLRSPGAALR